MPKKTPARVSHTIRMSPTTLALLKELADHLTTQDGIRVVTATEIVERAIHALAREHGLATPGK
jgi:hypothetical protein